MTATEFNTKYQDYLEKGHYGLAIDQPELTAYLDLKFQEFIQVPGFKFSQIKAKFGMGRFYCEGLTWTQIQMVEEKISQL